MPSWLMVTGDNDGSAEWNNITTYWPPCGFSSASGTETRRRLLSRDSYTLSDLLVRVISNGLTAASTIRTRKNGANGNQSVSIGAGATGVFEDGVNTDTLASGDTFNYQVVPGATGTNMVVTIISHVMTSTNDSPIIGGPSAVVLGTGKTCYTSPGGNLFLEDIESPCEYTWRVAATTSNFRVNIPANSLTAASTARTRKNGANGNQSVSIGAGATGDFEDAVNTDTLAAGDEFNYQVVTGATGTTINFSTFMVKSSSTGRQVMTAYPTDTALLPFGQTRWYTLEGETINGNNSAEVETQCEARTAFTAQNMLVNVNLNGLNGPTTYRLRENGGNSNLVISVGLGLTGIFEDLVNIEGVVATDLLNWQQVTDGTGGSIATGIIGFQLDQPAPAPGGLEDKSANMGSKMVGAGLL